MAPTISARTIRLRGLDPTATAADFESIAKLLSEKASGKPSFFSRTTQASEAPQSQVSYLCCSAPNGRMTGVCSFNGRCVNKGKQQPQR